MAEESVEDALRDLGIEMPKPATQAWHYNPRVPRSIPPSELEGEALQLVLAAIEEGSPQDGLDFESYDSEARVQIAAAARKELAAKFHHTTAELEGKALVGQVVAALQSALKAYSGNKAAPSKLTFDRSEKQGNRPTMEDKMVVISDVNTLLDLQGFPEQAFFGIFDGHAGVDAARYAQAHLLLHICRHELFASDLQAAIAGAHASLDQALCSKPTRSGCTSVTAFLRGHSVYVAWLGDSAAVLSRASKFVPVMDPHKPGRLDEKERIEAAGGMVMQVFGVWRVNGVLSVARAFGDQNLKAFVISTPDIFHIELTGEEDFIVLACDGLWDVMSPEEVIAYVHANVKRDETGRAAPGVADQLSDHAIDLGSTDNVSVIVAYFTPGGVAADASTPRPAAL